MINLNAKQSSAAENFLAAILGERRTRDGSQSAIEQLVCSAFLLYSMEWGTGFDIRQWQWPFQQLESGEGFKGYEPWSVLLREAVKLGRDGNA